MNHLYLLRHGAAETEGLYKEGRIQAENISINIVNYLNNRTIELDKKRLPFESLSKIFLLYSKTQRTTETANIIEKGLDELTVRPSEFVKWKSGELYHSKTPAIAIVEAIKKFDHFNLGIIVGHNEDICYASEILLNENGLVFNPDQDFHYSVGNCCGYHLNFTDKKINYLKPREEELIKPKEDNHFF